MQSVEQIKPVVKNKLEELGLELFELRLFNAGRHSILRVTIDSSAGVSIADCEKVSRELSLLLDVENFFSGKRYNLEVSSPGIDRPLTTERDFNRIAGKPVVLHTSTEIAGKKTVRGNVVNCRNDILTVEIESQKLLEIPLCEIHSGREEIRFK